MPLPYIVVTQNEYNREDKLVPLARIIVVIEGQPYYFSTSENSGIRLAFPFLMFSMPINCFSIRGLSEIYDVHYVEKLIKHHNSNGDAGFLVKFTPHVLKPFARDLTLQQEHKVNELPNIAKQKVNGLIKSVTPVENIMRRTPTKKTLITSVRLSCGSPDKCNQYSQDLLKAVGLNDLEIKEAFTPLYLNEKPDMQVEINWPKKNEPKFRQKYRKGISQVNEINRWLVHQGAEVPSCVIEDSIFITQSVWKKTSATNKQDESPSISSTPQGGSN